MPPLTVLDGLRACLLNRPGATEDTPFGPDTLVYRVGGKLFALVGFRSEPLRITLKCDPVHALELRDQYSAVLPGYHTNHRHWNTIVLDGSVDDELIMQMIDDSYSLVVLGLPKHQRDALAK